MQLQAGMGVAPEQRQQQDEQRRQHDHDGADHAELHQVEGPGVVGEGAQLEAVLAHHPAAKAGVPQRQGDPGPGKQIRMEAMAGRERRPPRRPLGGLPEEIERARGPLYEDLVEEALCFGWIDTQARRLDDERRIQWFSPRRKGGLWSALNKQRVERLIDHGLMTSAGQRVIDSALADGSWSQADDVDALVIPLDLAVAFNSARPARDTYESLPDSTKKQHLWWIQSAKRAPPDPLESMS